MTATGDLGFLARQRIARLWEVSPERAVWLDNGFEWWPGPFRVTVTSHKHSENEAWRLSCRTDFMKGVDLADPSVQKSIGLLSRLAPTFAWVYLPPELAKEKGLAQDGAIWFSSTAYLRQDNVDWLPEFFGRMVILQPIFAANQAELSAELVKGHLDTSGPLGGAVVDSEEPVLDFVRELYRSEGLKPCAWNGCEEFTNFADAYGRQEHIYANANPSGMTVETPIGSESVLMSARSDFLHPMLGTGLLSSTQLPFFKDEAALLDDCLWFNFFEASQWTDVPQFGSWHTREVAEDRSSAARAIFIPNALFMPVLATNSVMWNVGVVHWMKTQFYSDLVDDSMPKILTRRYRLSE